MYIRWFAINPPVPVLRYTPVWLCLLFPCGATDLSSLASSAGVVSGGGGGGGGVSPLLSCLRLRLRTAWRCSDSVSLSSAGARPTPARAASITVSAAKLPKSHKILCQLRVWMSMSEVRLSVIRKTVALKRLNLFFLIKFSWNGWFMVEIKLESHLEGDKNVEIFKLSWFCLFPYDFERKGARKEGRVKFKVLWKESSRFFHVLWLWGVLVVDIADSSSRTGTVKPSSRKVMSRECRY